MHATFTKSRLEAFSDGVLAIIITIMVLEMKAPVGYWLLQNQILRVHGNESVIARAVGRDWKGKASLGIYATAVGLAFVATWVAQAIYVLVALMWLVPDRRIERALAESAKSEGGADASHREHQVQHF